MIASYTHFADFQKSLYRYQEATGKTMPEIVARQGRNMMFFINDRLRSIAPKKGSIRNEVLSAMKSGRGIKIRDSFKKRRDDFGPYSTAYKRYRDKRGRRLNSQAYAAMLELSARESARGFTRYSTIFGKSVISGKTISRFDQTIGESVMNFDSDGAELRIQWGYAGRISENAAASLTKDRAAKVIDDAIADTTQDIMNYLKTNYSNMWDNAA